MNGLLGDHTWGLYALVSCIAADYFRSTCAEIIEAPCRPLHVLELQLNCNHLFNGLYSCHIPSNIIIFLYLLLPDKTAEPRIRYISQANSCICLNNKSTQHIQHLVRRRCRSFLSLLPPPTTSSATHNSTRHNPSTRSTQTLTPSHLQIHPNHLP
jgi:hypothetical protein